MTKKLVVALVAAGLCLGLVACKTVKGLGGDIESVGSAGSDVIH